MSSCRNNLDLYSFREMSTTTLSTALFDSAIESAWNAPPIEPSVVNDIYTALKTEDGLLSFVAAVNNKLKTKVAIQKPCSIPPYEIFYSIRVGILRLPRSRNSKCFSVYHSEKHSASSKHPPHPPHPIFSNTSDRSP